MQEKGGARRLRLAKRSTASSISSPKSWRELAEARRNKQDDPHVREELGDVFFTLVNLSRALGIDAETAMREANEKFYKRFRFMEQRAADGGKTLSDLSLDELEELWQLAKTQSSAGPRCA